MSSPSNAMRPSVGGKKPEMTLNSVVLPAPFGPMTANTVAFRHVEADRVVGDEAAEALGDILDREERHAAPPASRASAPAREHAGQRRRAPWARRSGSRIRTDAVGDVLQFLQAAQELGSSETMTAPMIGPQIVPMPPR